MASLLRTAGRARGAVLLGLALLVGACASPGPGGSPSPAPRGGGYYQDDGPGAGAPVDLDAIPDAVPRAEPLLARANRPYEVFGRRYVPMTRLEPYRSRGAASWYGRKYHGRQTSSGEVYDMYGMTAAHPTLPLPSYVRVTHQGNGRSVVVRVNDRGPFLNDRVIDLSWTAAAKLGFVQAGSAEVEVELLGAVEVPAAVAANSANSANASPVLAGGSALDGPPLITMSPVAAPAPDVQAPAAFSQPPSRAVPGASAASAAPAASAATATPAVPAAPAAPAVPAAPAAPAAAGGPGLFLQFGALTSLDGAQAMRERIGREFGWLAQRLQVRADGGLFKVDAGPWAGRDEALAAAERIRHSSVFRPFPVAR
ncbi:septal ring lytic transglycosylase RlpA family protein [Quisquiliibacterium transsilvanicum]|uniref:Endolytic peptidoglycan transglycosylase RlpA n=1 Tax=Quisquiliibacterium transsilvanicum TaxID=1549638 RepID=A0A7W8HK00_9BURK|nr:septal ring lytic transglycosylase RlpA family protein [Quisquiliibacterium transsilvanicum]MBB5272565.1 rare lipoprotein A [Quisquiliibacterium transsilvanicum]